MEDKKERHKNLGLRSEPIRDLITMPPPWSLRWGSLLILGTILSFLFLSWMIKYPDKVAATGILTADQVPQKLFARFSGNIDSLFVDNGQQVYKGQLLAVLENPANTEDVLFLNKVLDTIRAKENLIGVPLDRLRFLNIGEVRPAYESFENALVDYTINSRCHHGVPGNGLTGHPWGATYPFARATGTTGIEPGTVAPATDRCGAGPGPVPKRGHLTKGTGIARAGLFGSAAGTSGNIRADGKGQDRNIWGRVRYP